MTALLFHFLHHALQNSLLCDEEYHAEQIKDLLAGNLRNCEFLF